MSHASSEEDPRSPADATLVKRARAGDGDA
ncbi:MAG: hypothetical protein JWO18_1222, partial [Microbacteriaceae bacterium]|nr:hypothetical protein [Microbacteriaceae bacterium]